jgi:hypothetical protein
MSPMSPSFDLQLPRKHQKMGIFPGSSMVEHSAVNRRVASSNLARGAKSFSNLQRVGEAVVFHCSGNCSGHRVGRAWNGLVVASALSLFPIASNCIQPPARVANANCKTSIRGFESHRVHHTSVLAPSKIKSNGFL